VTEDVVVGEGDVWVMWEVIGLWWTRRGMDMGGLGAGETCERAGGCFVFVLNDECMYTYYGGK
jgi:hypothetical protein